MRELFVCKQEEEELVDVGGWCLLMWVLSCVVRGKFLRRTNYASGTLNTTGEVCFSFVASCLKLPILDHLVPLLTLKWQAFGHRGDCIGDILARVLHSIFCHFHV